MQKFDYPYKKSINVTAWVLQILLSLIALGVGAWGLAVWNKIKNDSEFDDYQKYSSTITGVYAVQIVLACITILLDIAEIILSAKSRLLPAIYLTSACIKTLIWGVIFILGLVSLALGSIIMGGIIFITSLIQLVYGARIVHKKRRGTLSGGSYKPAANGQEAELGFAPSGSYAAYNPPVNVNTAYNAPQGASNDYYSQPEGVLYTRENKPAGY
ncbi:hypothetical protein K431DRAFT_343006 [Polychaeton citri CBS 116435]|uniref:Uncharacterized protein n=1 Tax=Polychaeton citri CBS 116435 TaxID=1314669 RepID=A0A9P4QIM3_9PEZI|nr:hypothetical protein K431DRAFT_343006 [Polychaeton citri CBS 116435]